MCYVAILEKNNKYGINMCSVGGDGQRLKGKFWNYPEKGNYSICVILRERSHGLLARGNLPTFGRRFWRRKNYT